ncbi:MAG: hypothetical protein Q9225_005880 [Loekoesia sp. 1 TL-2023]
MSKQRDLIIKQLKEILARDDRMRRKNAKSFCQKICDAIKRLAKNAVLAVKNLWKKCVKRKEKNASNSDDA